MPWDVTNKEDKGGRLLGLILSSGWLVNLYRGNVINYHNATTELLKRGKDKQSHKKISKVKDWEKEAHNVAGDRNESRKRRRMIVMLLEEYSKIFEDQPQLLGVKILLILTLLSQASAEINWIVVHQVEQAPPKTKNHGLRMDLETIQILFYMEKIRNLIRDFNTKELLYTYLIAALKEADLKDIESKLEVMDANTNDLRTLVENIKTISLVERDGEKMVESKIHRCDLGRLITQLSVRSQQTSSPMQKDANLAHQLELTALHVQMIRNPDKVFREAADLTFLYFFSDTFMDYFNHCFSFIDNTLQHNESYQIIFNFSHLIAFPSICQDFTECLNSMCPEEYEEVIRTSRDLANDFLETMAEKTAMFLDKYCKKMIRETLKQQPRTMASKFVAKYNKEVMENPKEIPESEEESRTRRMTASGNILLLMKNNLVRKYLFETNLENISLIIRELPQAFFQMASINIANFTLIPENYLLDIITEKVREQLKSYIYFDTATTDIYSLLPSQILLKVSTYCQSLINIDPGLDLANILKETLYDLRADDEVVHQSFLNKYLTKLFQLISTPHCYYNKSLACFVQLNTNMEYSVDWPELFTSCQELQALSELVGTEGILWMIENIRKDITASISGLVSIVNRNSDILQQKQPSEDILKQLSDVPSFILTCIDIGKKLGLLNLVVEAHENQTRQRIPYLQSLMDLMITPEPSCFIPFEVSESTLTIVEAMGLQCDHKVDTDPTTSQQILDMLQSALPLLASLTSSRYFHSSLNSDPIELDCHKNSINCLGDAVNMIIK